MTGLLRITGVRCLAVSIVGAIPVMPSCSRVSFLARNIGAVFDGAETAETLVSVEALVDLRLLRGRSPTERYSRLIAPSGIQRIVGLLKEAERAGHGHPIISGSSETPVLYQ